MKSLVAVLVACAFVSFAQAVIDKEKAIEVMTKCKKSTGASEDINEIIEKHLIPTTPEGKCMMACVLEEQGIMKDGKFDSEGAPKFFKRIFKEDEGKLQKAAEVVAICAKTDVKGMNNCEASAAYLSCAKANNFNME